MIEALIAGEGDPKVLADLAREELNTKRAALLEALNGRFDDHHADLSRLLLDQIDACTAGVDRSGAGTTEETVGRPLVGRRRSGQDVDMGSEVVGSAA